MLRINYLLLAETSPQYSNHQRHNMEEIKASKSSIGSLLETKMGEQTRILMAAIMDMKKGKSEGAEEV